MSKFREVHNELKRRRATLERRLEHIQDDLRRVQGPLDSDSEERAVELENDPVLDALDASGRDELAEVKAALDRLEGGEYGYCSECGKEIPIGRLHAAPTARTCATCAA